VERRRRHSTARRRYARPRRSSVRRDRPKQQRTTERKRMTERIRNRRNSVSALEGAAFFSLRGALQHLARGLRVLAGWLDR
jgi:hypothetical protein